MSPAATSKPKRYASVVRVSHMGARRSGDDNVHADRDQAATIERWARERGVEIDALPPELDVSGGLPLERRPSLLKAIEGIEAGVYDGVAVAYLSRFGRNLREQLRAWDRIEAAGGEVVVVQEGIDSSSPSGRLHRNMLLSIAEHEREQHAERFEHLREWATGEGVWQRRQTPRGYRRDEDTRKLVPDEQAHEVRAAFTAFDAGRTISDISREMKVTPSGLRYLLRNRVYLGELSVGKHVNPAAHPALIEDDLFERVGKKLAQRERPARNGHPVALLSGIARCAGCGHVLSRGSGSGGLTYRCAGYHSGAWCPARAGISAARLEDHVEGVVLRELERLSVSGTVGDRAAEAEAAVVAAEGELRAFLSGVQAAGIDPNDFADALRERKRAVDDAKAALEAEQAASTLTPLHRGGHEVWADLNPAERNTLLRSLLSAVVVVACGRGRRVPMADRAVILRHGADVHLPTRNGGDALGIHPLPFDSLPANAVL
jgi:DNA invertase Pin-like site-specific DNA recombinase